MFYSTAEDIKRTYRANPVSVNGIIAQGQISRHLSRYVQDNHRREPGRCPGCAAAWEITAVNQSRLQWADTGCKAKALTNSRCYQASQIEQDICLIMPSRHCINQKRGQKSDNFVDLMNGGDGWDRTTDLGVMNPTL
jgi:hypothetical protein